MSILAAHSHFRKAKFRRCGRADRTLARSCERGRWRLHVKSALCAIGLAGAVSWTGSSTAGSWSTIDRGLEVAEFDAPMKSHAGDSRVTVVRVDPAYFSLRVLCAVNGDSLRRSTRDWCEVHGLAGAINAGMYATDYLTHVGYLKSGGKVHNGTIRKDYKTVLLCDPVDAGVPAVQIADVDCRDFSKLIPRYRTAVQNLRMISCRGTNVWSQQDRRYSMGALGMDASGRVLFLFCESPYSVHDLNAVLLALPIDIRVCMYLEGGAPASMYVSHNGVVIDRNGLYETGGAEGGGVRFAHALPNVIGFVKRQTGGYTP